MPEVVANGVRLYYEEAGEGPPLVFLGGLGADHRAFAGAIRHFAVRYRVVAIDHRDAGRSQATPIAYSTADMADNVAAVLWSLGLPPAHVVGQSMGGLVAQKLAIRHPNRVRSLVLVSARADSGPWQRALVESWIEIRSLTDPGGFARATLPWLVAPEFFEKAGQVEGLIRFAEENRYPQSAEAFARQARAVIGHDARSSLDQIEAPGVVLVGEHDLVTPPRFAHDLARALPNARFQKLPGVGHIPHIEDPATFRNTIAEFLATLP